MERSPVDRKVIANFAMKLAVVVAFVNVGAQPAFALSASSTKRLNEMQAEASAELKSLQTAFAKKIAVYKTADIKLEDATTQVAEQDIAPRQSEPATESASAWTTAEPKVIAATGDAQAR